MTALATWNDGAAKKAIVDFVGRVTMPGPDFVPPAERIATFDNDGTLWCEYPMQAQVYFILARLEELAAADPAMAQRQPFKAFLERDLETIKALGKKGVMEVAFATHAGCTADEFEVIAAQFLESARHPQNGRRFRDNIYAPQVELVSYLHAHDFRVFIVTGGGMDFVRAISEPCYGIARERVVGSASKSKFELRGDRGEIVKLAELDTFDDRDVKPQNIYLHIGRRPILAFGNSDGDLAMLRYTKSGEGLRLALLLHHDDAAREFAYDRDFKLSPLVDALDRAAGYGIEVVSMKRDWRTVFPEV